jgi:magnesium-transporting ATPase (P-type)
MDLTRERVIEINKELGLEFGTDHGLGGNSSNLDYALSLDDPYQVSKEIIRGHPFVDANKRTGVMVYLMLTTKKSYDEILKDFYDVFQNLSV